MWFGDDVDEDIWKCRFTYRPMANMAKTEQGISIMVFICWTTQEIWDVDEADLEKQRIKHTTPEILKSLRNKTPTSNVAQHRKLSDVDLFFVPEKNVWNEGSTQTGSGRGTSWVAKHE